MRPDAAQFCIYKAIHKMQTPIQPCEKFVFNFVVHGERHLGAVRADLGKINDAHQANVSADRLERILARRISIDRQQHRVRFEAKGSAKAEIDGLG